MVKRHLQHLNKLGVCKCLFMICFWNIWYAGHGMVHHERNYFIDEVLSASHPITPTPLSPQKRGFHLLEAALKR